MMVNILTIFILFKLDKTLRNYSISLPLTSCPECREVDQLPPIV